MSEKRQGSSLQKKNQPNTPVIRSAAEIHSKTRA